LPKLIAFLRAINVGGHNVTMEVLREHFEALGLRNVETFIASGNVIFETASKNIEAAEQKIEAQLHKSLGYEVKTFIRTDSEVARIAVYQPFEAAHIQPAKAFVVGFLAAPLDAAATKSLMSLCSDDDKFHVNGRELYWIAKKGQGESTFSNALFEKMLKVRTTFRGMKTLQKLAAKYPKG
jgi:uncharacterized protein (DUF1697 family)